MKSKLIKIEDCDVRHGERVSPSSCPIALALKRETGLPVSVGSCIYYTVGKVVIKAPTPPAAQEFIEHFDLGRKTNSISLELPVPEIS